MAFGKGCIGYTGAKLPEDESDAHTLAPEGVHDDR